MAGAQEWSEHQGTAADTRSTSLPTWLLKELERAGVVDEIIEALDEDTARDLIAEIRSDSVE
jgi:hypothetical protein